MKLSDEDILSIIEKELAASKTDSIEANRRDAMSHYLGEKGQVIEGRSSVVSTDVADAIEWIMPEVVKAFTQNNEVVTFDPVSANDKRQAELESRYVYDVLMKENNGFILIHTFIKDALLQKNGFVKAFYESSKEVSKEDYLQLTEPELAMLHADPEIEITGQEEEQITTEEGGTITVYNVNCTRTRKSGKVTTIPVAPEDFRCSAMHNSVDLSNVRFCAHLMLKTKSDLIEDGFDRNIVNSLEMPESETQPENYRFSMMGESVSGPLNSGDDSQTIFEIAECYIKMDIDGDGIAERCKITVAGYDKPTTILDIEEVDSWPFISATAILMSHKLFGLSIYDRLKEIQQQKTAIIRNILDNLYLQNNQRTVVVEGQVNLDDVMVSRPGGIMREKVAGAIRPYTTPPLSSDTYRMVDYLDQVRSGRAGVSPEGSVHDTAMGDSVGSQGLERLLTQKEELVGLMIRVFAETGIKPLCNKIRDLLIKHKDVTDHYEFHGEWVDVKPAAWIARSKSTVRVGTGSGNRKEQAAAIMTIIGLQKEIYAQPGQSLVAEQNIYAAINDLAKFSGMPGAGGYFVDPASPEGQNFKKSVQESMQQQQQQALKEKQLMVEAQAKIAEAETTKAIAAQESVRLKAQIESQKQQYELYKASVENELKALKQQLDEAKLLVDQSKVESEIAHKYYQTDTNAAIAREQIDLQLKLAGEKQSDRRDKGKA